MKKVYILLAAALVSSTSIAQSSKVVLKGQHTIVKSELSEKVATDTAGWTSAGSFYPEFAVGGQVYNYGYTGGGYVYGNNADGLNICAQGYLNANNSPVGIEEVIIWATGKTNADNTSQFSVKIYQMATNSAYTDDGAGNPAQTAEGPSTLMYTEAFNLLDADTTWPNVSIFQLSQVVGVGTGNFAIAIDCGDLDAKGDTLGLLCDNDGSSGGTAEGMLYNFHYYQNVWWQTDFLFGGLNNNIAIFAVVDENFVGIDSDDYFNGVQMSAYPNPAVTNTTIAFNLEKNFSNVTLKVMDATGKVVANINKGALAQGEYKEILNVTELPSGNYYYTLYADGSRLTKKFIVLK